MPFVNPFKLLQALWLGDQHLKPPAAGSRTGVAVALEVDARAQAAHFARQSLVALRAHVPADRWVRYLDFLHVDSPACVPLPDVIEWLRVAQGDGATAPRGLRLATPARDAAIDLLGKALEIGTTMPVFREAGGAMRRWSLQKLPAWPPRECMVEFVPSAPWEDAPDAGRAPYLRWRDAIRPVLARLEAALGQPVCRFVDEDDAYDSDRMHRFVLLHWCCSFNPQSDFVRYLVQASGAKHSDALKAALVDPASYELLPFRLDAAAPGMEASSAADIRHVPAGGRHRVAVAFMTAEARDAAQWLINCRLGADLRVVAPRALIDDAWIAQAARHARSCVRFDAPAGVVAEAALADVDELIVVADHARPHGATDLALSASVEELLWTAHARGLAASYFGVDMARLHAPEDLLHRRGVPERVRAKGLS